MAHRVQLLASGPSNMSKSFREFSGRNSGSSLPSELLFGDENVSGVSPEGQSTKLVIRNHDKLGVLTRGYVGVSLAHETRD